MKMYVPPAIWSAVHSGATCRTAAKARPERDFSSVRAGAAACPAGSGGPALTSPISWTPCTLEGSTT